MCVERNDKNQRRETPTTGAAPFWGAWAGGRLQRELGDKSEWCFSTQPALVAAAAAAAAAISCKQAAQSCLKAAHCGKRACACVSQCQQSC